MDFPLLKDLKRKKKSREEGILSQFLLHWRDTITDLKRLELFANCYNCCKFIPSLFKQDNFVLIMTINDATDAYYVPTTTLS